MFREAIAKGDTVEQAFANACRELGVDTTDAEFEILEMPQKKTFGLFGGAPARVRAYIEEPDPVVEPEPQPQAAQPGTAGDPAQKAAEYLKNVLREMGLADASVDIQKEEAGAALTLSGDDIGFIIGHRGETLDALQYLASLVANHVDGSYFRITLDVGNYREKRKETLESLGKKMAARAVKDRAQLLLGAHEPLRAAHHPHGGADRARRQKLERGCGPGPACGHRARGRGASPSPGATTGAAAGTTGTAAARGSYNDRNRRPRNDRSRLNSAPRAEGPKSDDPNTPIYGRIEKK